LRQALSLFVAVAALCELAVVALEHVLPRVAARMVSPTIFALLLLTCMSFLIVQSMAIYLRSFKREPFVIQSVVIAVSTVLLSFLAVKGWGSAGAVFIFLSCTGVFGLISGTVVFRRWTGSV
jgi:hypothetical protein